MNDVRNLGLFDMASGPFAEGEIGSELAQLPPDVKRRALAE